MGEVKAVVGGISLTANMVMLWYLEGASGLSQIASTSTGDFENDDQLHMVGRIQFSGIDCTTDMGLV